MISKVVLCLLQDEAGNQTQSNENGFIRNYRYDAAGRLYDVTDGSTLLATYSYGASNQRLQLIEGGLTTLYAWEGGSVIAEYNGASNGMVWTKSYVYLGGRLLATDATSGVQYHHPDRLGTRLVTSSTGAVVSENINLPFGNTINGESNNLAGSASKKRFTSYDRSDTTKLDYANNRHYSSAQGRFTQVDPLGMSATQLESPQSLNLYAYCGNDPINQTDPSGLFSLKKLFGWVSKALKWIAIAAIVAVSILTFVAPAALVSLSGWVASHSTLAALFGINAPHFAIINLAATAGGASVSLGVGASVSALVGAVSSFAQNQKKDPKEEAKKAEAERVRRVLSGLLGAFSMAIAGIDLNGIDREIIICQAYLETSLGSRVPSAGSRFKGPNFLGTAEAKVIGYTGEQISTMNTDLAFGAEAAAKWLSYLKNQTGNITDALRAFRFGVGAASKNPDKGSTYADKITKCADSFKAGKAIDGLLIVKKYP